jgi:hypothetical protein
MIMKKALAIISGLLVLAMAAVSFADTSNSALARTHVKVSPDIAVSALTPNVDMGSVQRGVVTGLVDFRVDANQQYVNISVAASPLFKGDDPVYAFSGAADAVAPIAVVPSAAIHPDNGTNPATGLATIIAPLTITGLSGNYPTLGSLPVTFEAASNGHFSQVVHTAFSWNQDQVEKPAGDYSGIVVFTAALLP